MARLARIVIPHLPHHVTQRGNRRQQVFFGDDDYRAYLSLNSVSHRWGSLQGFTSSVSPDSIPGFTVESGNLRMRTIWVDRLQGVEVMRFTAD